MITTESKAISAVAYGSTCSDTAPACIPVFTSLLVTQTTLQCIADDAILGARAYPVLVSWVVVTPGPGPLSNLASPFVVAERAGLP